MEEWQQSRMERMLDSKLFAALVWIGVVGSMGFVGTLMVMAIMFGLKHL